ncbi:MAG: transketolase family protein [bacterium]
MRNAFADEITALAKENEKIILLSGDIGNRLFNVFKDTWPDRFYNCGVAEANMTSMAAGMALCGLHPVTYTIAAFNTVRCLEQIRVDVCYHNMPVVIVGVGAGLSYAGLGATHQSCEDITLLRALPNMTVICPGDAVEVRLALRAAIAYGKPVYIRLGKKGEPVVHKKQPLFEIGKGIVIHAGEHVCLLSTGTMLSIVHEAAMQLEKKGVSAQVVSMHTVKPLDTAMLAESFARFDFVAAVEEHTLLGGFSGAIAEWIVAQPPLKGKLLRFGTPDKFLHSSGNQQYARTMAGLTAEGIAATILNIIGHTP